MSMARGALVVQALKCFDCRAARRLGSCGSYCAPDLQLRSVAHYVADRGAVIPRSMPIMRRRSWDRAVVPEGINRREEINLLPLRSFPLAFL